jgi:hypothetical protein
LGVYGPMPLSYAPASSRHPRPLDRSRQEYGHISTKIK